MAAGQGLRVAVIGGGWAGIAAAVQATQRGHRVKLFEMAAHLGGRAQSHPVMQSHLRAGNPHLTRDDNGQHILIGAYSATLALMQTLGLDLRQVLRREPLALVYPDGTGLRLPPGPVILALLRGVLTWHGVTWTDKVSLLGTAAGWAAKRFECASALTVAELTRGCSPAVQRDLIEPLCVAALNTPADQASAQVFLRVLHDALLGPRGASDLLLPRAPLDDLLPGPAALWLRQAGAVLALQHRVIAVTPSDAATELAGFRVDGEIFDRVVLATTATEAARLAKPWSADWAREASALRYEPIVTVYLHAAGVRWPMPMLALRTGADAPAQFGFDLGALGRPACTFAFVISGARRWVDRGLAVTAEAVAEQLRTAFPADRWPRETALLNVRAEKRATFACAPAIARPPPKVAPGLVAAGDYIRGPYPATLEGAVRSGIDAALAL
jgi:squalene-associated FAD-dependent desaturase